jgi:hypothetical protein|tara:strand:+ start:421 stop:642 length:222 start_codon:yes stop_codon:yes gene_type:complete
MKLTDILKEIDKNDKVQVPGFGSMSYGLLEKHVQKKVMELMKFAKKKDWDKYGKNNFNVLVAMWKTLAENMND